MGRVRVIFCLPSSVDRDGFSVSAPKYWPREHLAYITWYSRFHGVPDRITGMYRVEPALDSSGKPRGSIIALSDIRQVCMLTPNRTVWDDSWDTANILEKCQSFYVNNLQSKYSYQTIY